MVGPRDEGMQRRGALLTVRREQLETALLFQDGRESGRHRPAQHAD